MKLKILVVVGGVILGLFVTGVVKAQELPPGALSCGGGGLDTAIGCIPVGSAEGIVVFFGQWLLGMAGGIAFLLILVAAFQIITSRGNPEQLKAGQQLLGAAISGLLMIAFSLFIFRLIASDILKIPGLI